MSGLGFSFATLVAEEQPAWLLTYIFYKNADHPWVYVELPIDGRDPGGAVDQRINPWSVGRLART